MVFSSKQQYNQNENDMDILYTIFAVYLSGSGLILVRLLWHIAITMDKYDRKYSDTFLVTVIATFLWPVLFIKPRTIINISILYDNYGQAKQARFRDNPPPCGPIVRYRQDWGQDDPDVYGEFLFRTQDLVTLYHHRLSEHPHLLHDQNGAIDNWLNRYDGSLTETSNVPDVWWQFENVAEMAFFQYPRSKLRCIQCNADIQRDQVQQKNDKGQPGWNYNRLFCPQGHPLLAVRGMHVHVRRDV